MQTSSLARFGTGLAALLLIVVLIAAVGVFATIPSIQLVGTPTVVSAGTPPFDSAPIEAAVAKADPSRGEALFKSYGCVGCHGVPNGTGPYVVGLGKRAAERRAPGYSAVAYLYESITAPNAYVVPNYPPNVMPQNFKATIPPDQLDNLIAWLLTQ